MGLKEQLNAGATVLQRQKVSFGITGNLSQYTGSVDLNRTFILTDVQSSVPCRVRLYGNASSRNDPTELARPYASQSIPASIALITDITLTDTTLFNFAPPVFGANLDNPIQTAIYYTVDQTSGSLSGSNTISFTRFTLEDPTVVNLPSVVTRETLLITSSISTGQSITGSISTPKTYLLLQAIPDTSPVRLRLYSDASYLDNPNEISRTFGVEPVSMSGLIADLYMDVTETSSLTPVILGRNMETSPISTTYFNLTNDSVASAVNASLIVFSLED